MAVITLLMFAHQQQRENWIPSVGPSKNYLYECFIKYYIWRELIFVMLIKAKAHDFQHSLLTVAVFRAI